MKQTNEVKLTKEEVQANIVQMLQQVEYWQDVVDNWPSDAKYLILNKKENDDETCLLYTSPSPRDRTRSRMPSSA